MLRRGRYKQASNFRTISISECVWSIICLYMQMERLWDFDSNRIEICLCWFCFSITLPSNELGHHKCIHIRGLLYSKLIKIFQFCRKTEKKWTLKKKSKILTKLVIVFKYLLLSFSFFFYYLYIAWYWMIFKCQAYICDLSITKLSMNYMQKKRESKTIQV